MRVLLVANYKNDRQESMLRFALALEQGLLLAGVETWVIRPTAWFGRLRRSGTGWGKWLGYLDKFLLFPRRLRRAAGGADVVHLLDHANAMYVPHIARRPHLVSCHDLLAIRAARGEFPGQYTGWTGRVLQHWILRSLRRAQRITCISRATREDAIRLTGLPAERLSLTPMGLNHPYAPNDEIAAAIEARRSGHPAQVQIFAKHRVPAEPYLLHVGGTQWYKNRGGVIAMHAALRSLLGSATPRLIIVGPPAAGSTDGIEHRSGVDHDELASLYTGAEALLFPSLEEGFGWPIIEAQACGCRVVTTGKAPMTEVGGEAAVYLNDPADAVASAIQVVGLLRQDAAARRDLVARGFANAARFSTARMVQDYIDLYRELAGLPEKADA